MFQVKHKKVVSMKLNDLLTNVAEQHRQEDEAMGRPEHDHTKVHAEIEHLE